MVHDPRSLTANALKAMVGQEDDPAAGAFVVKLLEVTCGAPENSTG